MKSNVFYRIWCLFTGRCEYGDECEHYRMNSDECNKRPSIEGRHCGAYRNQRRVS